MTTASNQQTCDLSDYEMESLVQPIGDNEVGEDPRYGDNFDVVKSEIDRLSDTDYEKVVDNCRKILETESKDLRIAGYYILALVFTQRLDGLVHGVDCLAQLLNKYGNRCHPQRETAKQQSIAWLNNDKLSTFVNKIIIENDSQKENVSRIKIKVDEINSILNKQFNGDVTQWTSLNAWLQRNLPQDTTELKLEATDNVISITESTNEEPLNSDLSFDRASENLIAYLEKSGDWIRLISLSRALKWSFVRVPFHEEFKTKIPAPRSEILMCITEQHEDRDIEATLSLFESYFMEPGCQYFFDLQKNEVEKAKKSNRQDIVNIIEDYLSILIKRVPKIVDLSFDDGTPFANHATKHWLNSLNKVTTSGISNSKLENNIELKIEKILRNEDGNDLAEQMVLFNKIDTTNASNKCLIELAKIDACIVSGRSDLALSLANHLNNIVVKYHLEEWNAPLALQIWNKLFQIISCKSNKTESDSKRIDDLKERICAIDMGFAVKCI
jgi:type VI secretion system protein VasJ